MKTYNTIRNYTDVRIVILLYILLYSNSLSANYNFEKTNYKYFYAEKSKNTELPPCSINIVSAITKNCENGFFDLDVLVTYTNPLSNMIKIDLSTGESNTFTINNSGSETFSFLGLSSNGTPDVDITASFINIPNNSNIVKTCDIIQPVSCDGKGGVIFFWERQGSDCVWKQQEENHGVSGTYTEYNNGTATLNGTFDNNGAFNITVGGKTSSGTSHFDACNTSKNTTNWYYFTTVSGNLNNDNNCINVNSNLCGIENSLQFGNGASTRSDNNLGVGGWWNGIWCGGNNPSAVDINFDLVNCITNDCVVTVLNIYNEPNCPPCNISSITATPTPCNNSEYSLNGNINFTNPPNSGTLTVFLSDGSTKTFLPPFVSPLSYSFSGLNANGASQSVNAVFSANTLCSKSTTYTSPPACQLVLPCSIVANVIVNGCNSNNTIDKSTDDFYSITVSASATNPGGANKYIVAVGTINPLTGTGGNVLNPGGTTYGNSITLGKAGQLIANGNSTYTLSIRDAQRRRCFQKITIGPFQPCSSEAPPPNCKPTLCVPIRITKN